MTLRNKPDFEKIKARFNAWWSKELIDRCCIQIYAPKSQQQPFPPYLEQLHSSLKKIAEKIQGPAEDSVRNRTGGDYAYIRPPL